MSGTTEIRAALAERIVGLTPSGLRYPASALYPMAGYIDPASVAWENMPYSPVIGAAWYRATFMPGATTAAAMGTAAQNRYVGIWQIDCIYPRGAGESAAALEAERIAAAYARGTRLSHGGVTTTIEKAYRMAGFLDPEKPWFIVPVRAHWRADAGP